MSAERPAREAGKPFRGALQGGGKPPRPPRRQRSRRGDLVAIGLLAALVGALPFLGRSAYDYWFWLLAGALVANLALAVRRQKRLVRLAAWRRADPGHFLADLDCHLDWPRLAEGLHSAAAEPLAALFQSPSRDLSELKPLVRKALAGLRQARRLQAGHPGVWAGQAFALALHGQILGRENSPETLSDYPRARWSVLSCRAYSRAAALAGDEASIWADWGRHLEARARSLSALNGQNLKEDEGRGDRLEALEKYEKALTLEPDLFPAGWGRARLLAWEAWAAQEAGQPEAAREGLVQAVAAFESARRGRPVNFAFNLEFGRTVFSLARLAAGQGAHYFRYAVRLFLLAAEDQPSDPLPRSLAGQALAQAAALSEDPETARGLFNEALPLFREAAGLDPGDPGVCREAVHSLTSLFKLSPAGEKPEGGPAYGLLVEAAEWAARAVELAPGEETWVDWAEVLCAQAENGGKPSLLLAEAVRLYEKAARDPAAAPERAAVNWHNWGYALTALARTRLLSSRRLRLLKQAARKYAHAAGLSGDNLTTLENWGDLLDEMADLTPDPAQAAKLREQAEARFRQAIRLHPEEASPWRHWSAHHQAQALAEKDLARRRELWRAALDKVEEAARVNPEDALTWAFWGSLLLELLEEGPEYERPLLLAGALEKLEKARDLDRKDDETWNLLGRARLAAADLAEEMNFSGGPLNNAFLAGEDFRTACNLNPAASDHWAAWGQALFRVSQLLDNEASVLAALKEAYEKYLTAAALNPGDGEYQTGLGHILYYWGWHIEDVRVKADRFQKAYEHCGEAGRLAPENPLVWRNWAKVTEALASLEDDPHKSSAWQNEADEKYYHADALELPGLRSRHH